jgi:NAD-dependent SIR2 family protein deacetylase
VIKPDVVFFGGFVPSEVVADAYRLVDGAEAMLVVGSSLTVYSGYRFVKRASECGLPIALLNLGETRADPLATLRIEALATDVLPRLARRLLHAPREA